MKPVKPDVSFPEVEASVLAYWRKNSIIDKGLQANVGKEPFVFYDGPPFATGLPHYGHLLAGTLKDIVPRYWVMKGRYVERRWGWDCHGLPVEFEIQNELGLKGRDEIENYGVAKFNTACRSIVERYSQEWEETVYRTGRWVDFKSKYRTMDMSFMESVWWVIRQLWDQKLIYEDYRVLPYSWKLGTPLSNFEANLNYKEVQDPAITLRFKSTKKNRYFLAWTTTPWTLPANLALAVNAEVDYVELKEKASGDHYVLAKDRVAAYFKNAADYEVAANFNGKSLEGETYAPLFPYFKDNPNSFQVLLGEHVTATDGTGIVHTAPAHGEEDFAVAKKYKIPLVDATDNEGNLTEKAPDFKGRNIKEADKDIIRYLKDKKLLFRHDTYVHNYPFCWRSDTPLMQKAIPAWFVKLEPVKPQLLKNNSQTHWVPEHIRDGRFGNLLSTAPDWNISRNRFWGTPIPVWRCADKCADVCVGSVADLEKLSGKKITDIHKQFVDEITFPCPQCKKPMHRIPEVLDCWFESGAMPYGQQHYPFENKKEFEATFPADFIAEGIDQTRGWFYSLSVLSAALFKKPPFKNVIVNGLVLAEDGKKMSKRLKNYPDPKKILDNYGADAMRAYLMNSPASRADDLRFTEAGVKEVVRSVLLPFWNAYSFFVTYALADQWEVGAFDERVFDNLRDDSDRWIVSRLQSLIQSVDSKMAVYHLYEVVPEVLSFIEDLTNWYIRVNRRRFWEEGMSKSKQDAYKTLYGVLLEFSKVLAPILPFVTEEIFLNLAQGKTSVHLESFPKLRNHVIDTELEEQVALARNVVSMGHNIRSVQNRKVRQPLKELIVITKNPNDRKTVERFAHVIQAELNVKKVSFSSDEDKYVSLSAKANARTLGPKVGAKMKKILELAKQLKPDEVAKAEKAGSLVLEGEKVFIEDLVIERQPKIEGGVQTQKGVTVWLDTKLDDALVSEGRARELVNRIQKLRKDLGFQVTDRIKVSYEAPSELAKAFDGNRDYVSGEVLAQSLKLEPKSTWTSEEEIDGLPVKLWVEKI